MLVRQRPHFTPKGVNNLAGSDGCKTCNHYVVVTPVVVFLGRHCEPATRLVGFVEPKRALGGGNTRKKSEYSVEC